MLFSSLSSQALKKIRRYQLDFEQLVIQAVTCSVGSNTYSKSYWCSKRTNRIVRRHLSKLVQAGGASPRSGKLLPKPAGSDAKKISKPSHRSWPSFNRKMSSDSDKAAAAAAASKLTSLHKLTVASSSEEEEEEWERRAARVFFFFLFVRTFCFLIFKYRLM